MFDIAWTEMLVIAVILIVVVGPKDLPKMLRTFGKFTAKMSSMAGDFRKQFDEALKEAELDDVRKSVEDLRSLNPKNEIRKAFNPMEKAAADVRAGMDSLMRPKTPVPPVAASTDVSASEPLKTQGDEAAGSAALQGGEGAVPTPTSAPVAVEPLAPVAPLAPLAEPAPVAANAPKKPRIPRAPKAATAAALKPKPASTAKAVAPAQTSTVSSDVTMASNGAAAKPARSRKPKNTGTAT